MMIDLKTPYRPDSTELNNLQLPHLERNLENNSHNF